ncbi:MAG: ferrous iron transport protein A [Actinomycetota bacterium]|nr:ferrous iron transport protein A [Actinomycetota bacterium]
MHLNEIKPKTRCRIVKILGSGGIYRRLLDMGCIKGEEIEVVKIAPLGDPIDITVKGYHLTLRKNEAKKIEVEAI